jgi:hypothetical protein
MSKDSTARYARLTAANKKEGPPLFRISKNRGWRKAQFIIGHVSLYSDIIPVFHSYTKKPEISLPCYFLDYFALKKTLTL